MAAGFAAATVRRPVVGSGIAIAQTLLLVLVSMLPLGISEDGAGLVPHLALAPLFAASIGDAEGARIGPVGAFAAGLMVDVLSLAPLGVSAASYVAFHGIATREGAALRDLPASAKWMVFMPLAGAVAAVHVAAMMLIDTAVPSVTDIAVCLGVTALAYPAVSGASLVVWRRLARRSRPIRK